MANEDDREAPEMGDEQDTGNDNPPARERETPPARKPADRDRDRDRDREAPADPDEVKAELDRTRDALKKANREAAERRRRLEELEQAEADRKRDQMSEAERIKADRAEADRRAREAEDRAKRAEAALLSERINSAVERAAMEAGFEYPQDVPKLIDRDRIVVDDETGQIEIKTVRDAVERLAKDRPGLVNARRGGGTPVRETQPRRPTGEFAARSVGRNNDPYDQELREMGFGGRM
jgi:hypothetical protein